jgi:RNA polymerase sigma factor (sigma-70 family)
LTELQLIEGCLAENRTAQRALYDRYSRAMFTTAFRITGDFDLAGECLQDAFLQVFRHIGDFQRRSTIGAWIKSIVVRTALKKIERRSEPFAELPANHADKHIDWGEDAIDIEYLENAIQSLPEGCRSVFVLAEVEGYSHKEIAELLHISEGTSKSQLFHAKKRLQKSLGSLI